ncbi:Cytochrome P450 1A1 [Lamellibrachia satsuma]|nr:Cytochrome P450 1A1 [Lamellibrachia satsuma]
MAFLDLSGLPAWSSTEAFVFYVTFLLVWWLRAGRSSLTLPGPWGFPVLGHLPMLGARSFVTMNNYRKWYGDVYKLRMGQRDVVVVNGPTAIRTALVKKSADFAGRPDIMSFRHVVQGHSVAFAPYSANWLLHRRIAHRGITTTINDKKAPTDALISEEAMCLVRRMDEHKGEPFDPFNDVQETVMHVLFRLCFGKSCRPQDDALCEQLLDRFNSFQALQPKLGIVDMFPCTEYLLFRYVEHLKRVMTDLTRLIQPRVDEHLKERGESRDLMDTWLALADGTDETVLADNHVTRYQLLHTVQDVMGAGIDTTTNIIHWALLYMAAHPRVQERVQREIDEVVGRDRDPKQSDRELLAFTDACLIEVMRHSSVLPLMMPHSTTCDTSLGGHAIPRDTMVFFNLYSLCRDEHLWEDSHEFRPERFETKEGKLKAVNLLQFGLGRRRCIGENIGRLQVFLLFTTLMQRYIFRFPDDVTLPGSLDGDLNTSWRSKPYTIITEARHEF